jgi:hypothetical protein
VLVYTDLAALLSLSLPCKAQSLTQSHALLCSLSLLIRISRSNALSDCCLRAGYDMHSPFLRIWGSTVYGTQFAVSPLSAALRLPRVCHFFFSLHLPSPRSQKSTRRGETPFVI